MKDTEEMTEEERFAICVAAGVPVVHNPEWGIVDGRFVTTLTTAYPCAIVKVGNSYLVALGAPR